MRRLSNSTWNGTPWRLMMGQRAASERALASLVTQHHGTPRELGGQLLDSPSVNGSKESNGFCFTQDKQRLWFNRSIPVGLAEGYGFEPGQHSDHKPPNERNLKLGKTIRTLRTHLPTLLATPLPQSLLSPQITLRLFPSTHPHLPSVSGRIAYTAALWTSPVAWGRLPVVGNVKLIILSERMISTGCSDSGGEKLIVRWKTCGNAGKGGDVTEQIRKMMAILGRSRSTTTTNAGGKEEEKHDFHGLFIFEFDDEGRVVRHTIEHVEEGNNWERTARVIGVTDWLLGRARGRNEPEVEVALCRAERERGKGY